MMKSVHRWFSRSLVLAAVMLIAACNEHRNAYLDLQRSAQGGGTPQASSENANEALVYALVTDDVDLVAAALDAGADPYRRFDHVEELSFAYFPHGETGRLVTYPFAAATALVNLRPCMVVAECGALEAFAAVRSRAALDAIIAKHPVPDRKILDRALLAAASLSHDPTLFPRLVELGANIEATAAAGWRPLHIAVRDGNQVAVAALLALGAAPNGILGNREARGELWVYGPSLVGRYESGAIVLETAAYPMAPLYADRLTPLHMAAIGELGMETRMFLRFGTPSTYISDATRNYQPARWAGPPAYALLEGDVGATHRETWAEIAQALVEAGADTDAEAVFVNGHAATTEGWTPLHFAHFTKNEAAIEILEAAGADEDAPLSTGERPEEVTGGYTALVRHVVAYETAQRNEQTRQQTARQRSDSDGANLFGQMMALGGMAAITAYGAGQGMGGDAVAVGLAGAMDILTDGEANAIRTVQGAQQQQIREMRQQQSAQQAAGGAAIPGFQAPAPATPVASAGCANGFTVDAIAHSFLPISLPTPASFAATARVAPVRGGTPGDRAISLESAGGSGDVDRLVATILIPAGSRGPGSIAFVDDNTVAGLEAGAVGTFDAWRGREYANFRTNFDHGRNREMGSLTILSTTPNLRGSFAFRAVEDGYPMRGSQNRAEVSGTFCVPG